LLNYGITILLCSVVLIFWFKGITSLHILMLVTQSNTATMTNENHLISEVFAALHCFLFVTFR